MDDDRNIGDGLIQLLDSIHNKRIGNLLDSELIWPALTFSEGKHINFYGCKVSDGGFDNIADHLQSIEKAEALTFPALQLIFEAGKRNYSLGKSQYSSPYLTFPIEAAELNF